MTREYKIEDEGDCMEFHLYDNGRKIGGGLIDIDQGDPEQAFCTALGICKSYVEFGGVWGGVRPM